MFHNVMYALHVCKCFTMQCIHRMSRFFERFSMKNIIPRITNLIQNTGIPALGLLIYSQKHASSIFLFHSLFSGLLPNQKTFPNPCALAICMIINLIKKTHFSEPQIHGMGAVVGVREVSSKNMKSPRILYPYCFSPILHHLINTQLLMCKCSTICSWRKLNYACLILSKNQ